MASKERDFYKILGISKDATDAQIKTAYKKLALKYHPDRNKAEDAKEKFQEVAEAYEVLSNPEKRKLYDQFGEAGINPNFQAANGEGGFPGGFNFAGAGGPGVHFSFGSSGGSRIDPFEIFNSFFGGSNPMDIDDDGPGGFGGFFPMGGMGGMGRGKPRQKRKNDDVVHEINLSLEELYTGCTKKLKVTRKLLDGSTRQLMSAQKILEVNVKAGWKEGTKVTYPGEGDEGVDVVAGDVIFIIKQKKHDRFERNGNDLLYKTKISLKEALLGTTVRVVTLDKRTLTIPIQNRVIKPGERVTVAHEGMPISKRPNEKGNLIVEFDVQFPSSLTSNQKQEISRIL
eukprot:GCRY01002659.1.p1 GENE.GCRY01002659.1~~GCRY01002659.1.p1  ORF type:complete len:342 (-),score=35.24 GCRY01002659.1:238-1263(-)